MTVFAARSWGGAKALALPAAAIFAAAAAASPALAVRHSSTAGPARAASRAASSPALAANASHAASPPRAASRAATTFADALRSYIAGSSATWQAADTTVAVRAVIEATGPLPQKARVGRLRLDGLRFERAGVPVSFAVTYRNARYTLPVAIRLADRGGRWLVVSLLGPDYDVAPRHTPARRRPHGRRSRRAAQPSRSLTGICPTCSATPGRPESVT